MLTETERAALVEAIAEIRDTTEYIDREVAPVGTRVKTSTTLLACPADMSQIRLNLDVIESLTTRSVPEPDAIERAAKAIDGLDWDTGEAGFHPTPHDVARVALQAAAHGDADWLDAALDSLPPRSQFSSLPMANSKIDGLYRVKVSVHQDGKWWTEYQGQGPTRKAAILDAVAKARKEATNAS